MQLTVFRQAFDGLDILPLASNGEGQTRAYDPPIDDYAASTTNADVATFFGTGEADVIAEGLEQQAVGFQFQVILFAVNEQPNLFFHEFGAYLLPPRDSTYRI